MRIIGGKYRGKKLFSPQNEGIRPTSDRTREAVFNILRSLLGNDWSSLKMLDVFAGTGAVALEAVSQGVGEVTLIDKNPATVLKNCALFPQEQSKIKVLKADAQSLKPASRPYDLLFMDAPYQQNLSTPALAQLAQNNWLANQALCIIEVEQHETLILPPQFTMFDERTYGLARIVFARYQA